MSEVSICLVALGAVLWLLGTVYLVRAHGWPVGLWKLFAWPLLVALLAWDSAGQVLGEFIVRRFRR